MIDLVVSSESLSRIRFAFSPLWETVLAVRAFGNPNRSTFHEPWVRRNASRLTNVDVDLLTTVIRPRGYLPDFLHPLPGSGTRTFGRDVAALLRTDPALVSSELRHLAGHPIANAGHGRRARAVVLRQLAADPAAALARVGAELTAFWRAALRPSWPRIEALLIADLDHRLGTLAQGGSEALLRSLHPSITWDGRSLRITKYYDGRADTGDRGLVLVPCVFAWPEVVVRTADPQPAVTYSPRGIASLWASAPQTPPPLVGVLGRTRAEILVQLELPATTTALASQLDLAAPSVSAHLQALLAAGIVTRRRIGRAVLYRRSELGDALVVGAVPSGATAAAWANLAEADGGRRS